MRLNLEQPHTVFVVVAKDVRGFKRGFEKAMGGRFYLEYGQALDALRTFPTSQQVFYTIGEAVIGYPDETKKENDE